MKNNCILKYSLTILLSFSMASSSFGMSYSELEYLKAYSTIETVTSFIIGVFYVALFFKLWGMANNVSEIRKILERKNQDFTQDNHSVTTGLIEIEEDANRKSETEYPIIQEGSWASNVSRKEMSEAQPLVDFLEKGQIIVLYKGEMTICDMKNFQEIEKDCKVIYIKR